MVAPTGASRERHPARPGRASLWLRACRRQALGKEYLRMAAKVGGKGGGKFDLGQNSDMNVTPFVDVMLVLLIIFMVSIPAATVSIKLDLPPAIPPPPGTKVKEPILINIQRGRQIYIGEAPTSLDTLTRDLSAALTKD